MNKFRDIFNSAPAPDFDDVLEAFSTFDSHSAGYMPVKELLHLMKNLGEGLPDAALAQVKELSEPDADGQVIFAYPP